MHTEVLQKHSIVILGFGPNHYGVVQFLLEQGITLTIRDKNPRREQEFEAMFPQYRAQVVWQISENILKKIDGFTLIIRSPSIPVLSPELVKAGQKGVIISSQTKLFFDLCPARIIGVTGTKGKGTTCSLLNAILQAGYTRGKVYLAGNIGLDPFQFYKDLTPDDLVILELSSFQLQDLQKSPYMAIILTVGVDHLNHHKTVDEYAQAKASLLKYQGRNDIAIINGLEPSMQSFASQVRGLLYYYSRFEPRRQSAWVHREGTKETVFVQTGTEIEHFESTHRKLLGEHNIDNILPAVIAASILEIPIAIIAREVTTFKGLAHRLCLVGTYAGVDFYDDSIATMPEATGAAIQAFSGKRLHIILGGNEKGGDYTRLGALIQKACTTVSLLPGSATPLIKKALAKVKTEKQVLLLEGARDPLFPTILSGIQPHLQQGDVVVMSPAATSFASFADAKQRGDLFIQAVKERYVQEEKV